MKLYTPDEIIDLVKTRFKTDVPVSTVEHIRDRQYVCTPDQFVKNRLKGAWAEGQTALFQFLQQPNFVMNPDLGLDELTKRFVIYDLTDVELSEEDLTYFRITEMTVRFEFDTVDEYLRLQKEKTTHSSRVGYVMFDREHLDFGGYGLQVQVHIAALIGSLIERRH